ncbi:MAG: DUF1570 domain-containing protein [Planctomycetota bacterium]
MSETGRPPLPLILGALAGAGILAGVGLAALRGERPAEGAALTTQGPLPGETAAAKTQAPRRVDAVVQPASEDEPFALKTARRLLREGDEAAALDLLEGYMADEGPDPAALRLREAIAARCDELVEQLRGELQRLVASGQPAKARDALADLRRRLPGAYARSLDELGTSLGEAGAQDLAAARAELVRRQAELDKAPTPEGAYELALWARERGLLAEHQALLERTIALDGFHEGARRALGHKKHEGRWYSDDEYKQQVLGLVKDPDGRWVKPKPAEPEAVAKKDAPKKSDGVPPPPPDPFQEDKEWYQDPAAKVCEWEKAETYTSKYYEITTNIKPEYAKRYGKMMDQYFKRFLKVFKDFLPEAKYKKSSIFIHATKEEFHEKNPQVPKTAGGFYQPATKRVVCYHGLFGQQGTTRTVLSHEGTHQFEDIVLQGNFWNCPIWIIEGLAVFFESAYYRNGDVRIGLIPRERLYGLKRGLAANALIPLRTLIRTPQRQFSGYHYAHAWSLIYMVIYGGKSKKARATNQKWFSDLFIAALKGKVSPEQVEKELGGKEVFDELEATWKEWLKDLPYDWDPKKHGAG